MADRGDTHYHVPTLNRWFAFSALFILAASAWMMLFDFMREWKGYQRTFEAMEVERGREALGTPEAVAALEDEDRLEAELAQAEAERAQRAGELRAAQEQMALLEDALAKADAAARVAKQEADWERFKLEEHRLHHGEDEEFVELKAGLEELQDEMAATTAARIAAEADVREQQAVLDSFDAEIDAVEARIKDATRDIDLVRKKLAKIDPKDFPTKLANIVRDDIPGLDFIGPRLQINKVLPPDLTFDLNFTKKPRIDMCMTCHVPIDRPGFEEEEQPFASHPRLDLFLSAKSAHPMNEFGCTICHRGAGEALVFQRADHKASDEQEAQEWYEKYHWHKQHYWDYPMLSSEYVEASCVQCHKDSMELIEPEAPVVTEGYELFERYGCYSCHKVDWFPTKRRPGPSLSNIKQKTDGDFVHAWIAKPKGFRPATWMPQIFHLENYAADVKIADSEYGQGRPMMGDEWSDTALHAVGEFILSRSGEAALPPIPVEGDPLAGRETFHLAGCLACHNLAPYEEDERAGITDLALQRRGTNEHGPNLRGVATKLRPEWLYAWIKDPAAYWSETRMPDLRLSDQEAADIVAYMMEDPDGYFRDVPEDWEEGKAPYKRDVLEEQARWFFNRDHPDTLAEWFRTKWADDQTLLEVIGEKWVLNQGCHSCHEIKGLEGAQPIGTELSTWASKTVDKLDFGFIPELQAQERGMKVGSNEFAHFVAETKSYRENFLEQKLRAPRSFDREKVKNPTERLRMPWFDLTEDEIHAISVFVNGLVEDEVQAARMVPTDAKARMDFGKRVIRQKNCAACHMIEPALVDFTDEDGVHRSVRGTFLALEGDDYSPPTQDLHAYLESYVERMRAEEDEEFELEELIVTLYEPAPGLGNTLDTVLIEDIDSIEVEPQWGGDVVDLIAGYYLHPFEEVDGERRSRTGDPEGQGRVLDVDGTYRDHSREPYEKIRWTFAPPVLTEEGYKLQRNWFYSFLNNPYPLREQMRVRMPTFNWGDGEAGAVVDYFRFRAEETWPRKFARHLLTRLDLSTEDVAQGIADLGLSGSNPSQVQGIVDGQPVETQAGLPNLLAFADSIDFRFSPRIDPLYEDFPERTPGRLEEFLALHPDFASRIETLVAGADGPKCTQCHFLAGDPPTTPEPIGWAPDLQHTRERLRPDWLRAWLTNPAEIYPGTSMPANFALDAVQWQEHYPAPSLEQINAVMAWLYNMDRGMLDN